MDDSLISKKELLEITGISYGALYRWKRKGLLPEDWFIRKNTFTGPETFFPRDKALPRIAKIQEMKETSSLDELARTFSDEAPEGRATPERLIQDKLLSAAVTGMSHYDGRQILDFYGALYFQIADRLLLEGYLSLEECDTVMELLLESYRGFSLPPSLRIYRKRGVSLALLYAGPGAPAGDPGAKNIFTLPTAGMWEKLKEEWRYEG